MDEIYEDQPEIDAKPSRTQLKKQAEALQKLGERLMELPTEQLKKIDIPAELRQAVTTAKNIKQHGARKRQRQRIGALMREIDPEPIRTFFAELDDGCKREARQFQLLERWRDELVDGNDKILDEIFERYPETDRQHLLQLIRNARKERKDNRPPKAFRALFKYLREISAA